MPTCKRCTTYKKTTCKKRTVKKRSASKMTWQEAVKRAHAELKFDRFVVIGRGEDGKALLERAHKIYGK